MKIAQKDIIDKLDDIDLIIFSSGFEDRCTTLARSLKSDKIKQSLIFHLDDTYALSSVNLEAIQSEISSKIVIYPKNEPLATFDIFYESLSEINETERPFKIIIDISTFTREVLLILMKVVSLNRFSNCDITLVYTPNEAYSSDAVNSWMTKGVREIRSIVGYSGLHSPSKELLLLVLNGFEEERTEQIIESFEPSNLILGKPNANDSINTELNEISCNKFKFIQSKYSRIISDVFDFSCTDIHKTISILNEIINNNPEYNIIISPLNNKISTVAASIIGIKNENIQICYASANQYNIDAKTRTSNYFLVYNFRELLKS